MHWIPLPYHHNAFFTAMGDHFVGITALNGKPAGAMHFDFAEAVFANQDTLLYGGDPPAPSLNESMVKDRLGNIAANGGTSSHALSWSV